MTTPEKPISDSDEDDEAAPSGAEPTEVLHTEAAAPVSPDQTPAPARAVVTTPARSTVLRWLTPTLALAAVAMIALFGGILIGQHTAGPGQAASFVRPGGQGNQGGQGQLGGPGQQGGQRGGGTQDGVQGGPGLQGNATRPGSLGGLTAGTIQSIDGDTITVKLRDGSTVTVKTTVSTKVTKTEKSSVPDLKAGETVTVRGAKDGSGSVSATSISEGANRSFGARPGANG